MTNPATTITHNDHRRKTKTPTALDHFRNTVNAN
jgi:hypothetical protein